jgi:hypothetical protein
METLMNRRSYPFKPSPADQLVIRKWKWRLGCVYGAILLGLVVVAFVNPGRDRAELAKRAPEPSFSSVSMNNNHPTR